MTSSRLNLHFLFLFLSSYYSSTVKAIELPIGWPAVSFQYGRKQIEGTFYHTPGSSIHKEIIQKCIDEKILSSHTDCIEFGDAISYHVY